MATLEIHIDVPDNAYTSQEMLRLGDMLIDGLQRAALEPTPGNAPPAQFVGMTRWVHGQFSDGLIPNPFTR